MQGDQNYGQATEFVCLFVCMFVCLFVGVFVYLFVFSNKYRAISNAMS